MNYARRGSVRGVLSNGHPYHDKAASGEPGAKRKNNCRLNSVSGRIDFLPESSPWHPHVSSASTMKPFCGDMQRTPNGSRAG